MIRLEEFCPSDPKDYEQRQLKGGYADGFFLALLCIYCYGKWKRFP